MCLKHFITIFSWLLDSQSKSVSALLAHQSRSRSESATGLFGTTRCTLNPAKKCQGLRKIRKDVDHQKLSKAISFEELGT